MLRTVAVTVLSLSLGVGTTVAAQQYAPPPQRYSLTAENFGETLHVYRDGARALIDLTVPAGKYQPKPIHMRTLVNIPQHTALSWDLLDPKMPCGKSSNPGDWGDPFNYYAQVMESASGPPKQSGKATVNGQATTEFDVPSQDGPGKLWRDDHYGLVVRFMVTPKQSGQPVTQIDVREFTVGAPNAAVFAVPARCKGGK